MSPGPGEQLQHALDAGLPPDLLAVLMSARRFWAGAVAGHEPEPDALTGEHAAALWGADLDRALAHPLAPSFDELFVARLRRQRGLG